MFRWWWQSNGFGARKWDEIQPTPRMDRNIQVHRRVYHRSVNQSRIIRLQIIHLQPILRLHLKQCVNLIYIPDFQMHKCYELKSEVILKHRHTHTHNQCVGWLFIIAFIRLIQIYLSKLPNIVLIFFFLVCRALSIALFWIQINSYSDIWFRHW